MNAPSQVRVLTEPTAKVVFGGRTQTLRVLLQNRSQLRMDAPVALQLFQASSSTVAPYGPRRLWKTIAILPGQTVVEVVTVEFPSVRAETRFLVRLSSPHHVLGQISVQVMPEALLKPLVHLGGNQPLGVLDPANQLKPLLVKQEVSFEDLEKMPMPDFPGKLAIIGPFTGPDQVPLQQVKCLAALCDHGLAAVWIEPPAKPSDSLRPSFYLLSLGTGSLIVAQAEMIADLKEEPVAQLNLVRLARLAVERTPLGLPGGEPEQ